MNWCKIIETKEGQVLFFLEPDEDTTEGHPCERLHQMVRIDGVCSEVQIRNIPINRSEELFNSITEETALAVIARVRDVLK